MCIQCGTVSSHYSLYYNSECHAPTRGPTTTTSGPTTPPSGDVICCYYFNHPEHDEVYICQKSGYSCPVCLSLPLPLLSNQTKQRLSRTGYQYGTTLPQTATPVRIPPNQARLCRSKFEYNLSPHNKILRY